MLFSFLVTGFHSIVVEVLIREGFLQILIDAVEVAIENYNNVVQLTTDAAG